MAGSRGEIIKSLVANVLIACAKAVAAAVTGSGAMLAETLHSFADCGNEGLLLHGAHSAQRPPDASHPLGHGRAAYFYSFIVALLLFFGGGVFSIREGIHKILDPEPVENFGVALAILGFSLAAEGYSTWSNLREMRGRRGEKSVLRYLRESKDTDLIVVFGENAAAVMGLVLAGSAIALAQVTGDGRWDGAGSLAVGLVLVWVAWFLAREVKSLLVGEAADPEVRRHAEEIAAADPDIERVLNIITVQQGPAEILVAAKLQFRQQLATPQIVESINRFERALKTRAPEVRWSFIEPDDSD